MALTLTYVISFDYIALYTLFTHTKAHSLQTWVRRHKLCCATSCERPLKIRDHIDEKLRFTPQNVVIEKNNRKSENRES